MRPPRAGPADWLGPAARSADASPPPPSPPPLPPSPSGRSMVPIGALERPAAGSGGAPREARRARWLFYQGGGCGAWENRCSPWKPACAAGAQPSSIQEACAMRRAEGAPRAARTTGGSCVCVQFLECFRVISGSTRPISSLRVGVFTQMALILACARQKLKASRLCLDGGEQCGLCVGTTERARV